MPDREIASSQLQPTGDRVLTPVLEDGIRFGYRVVLQGVFRFAYSGEEFDAVFRAGPDGAFTRRHRYLQWFPGAPVLESEDVGRHRYVFPIPAEWKLEGQSVGVRVDVDQFVNEFLIPPSEVRSSLSGNVRMTVLQRSLAPASPWPFIAWTSVPAALVVGGIGWVIQRRMMLQGLSPDIQLQLGRIEQKHHAAHAALHSQPLIFSPQLDQRLAAVKQGAWTLAHQMRELRSAQRLLDRQTLEGEIEWLPGHLATLPDEVARREGESALGEKRKMLALLDEMERTESRCAMRLRKIEAVLDSTCLTLRGTNVGAAIGLTGADAVGPIGSRRGSLRGSQRRGHGPKEGPDTSLPDAARTLPAEEALRRELDAEVAAIREVEREVSACAALRSLQSGE